ncbi:TraX family protein, partial [uncultured Duncaniella sp.]
LAWWLGTDYDWRGVLMIAVFYILRHQTIRPWLERSLTHFSSQAILQIIFTFPLMAHYGIAGALLASGILFLYDGTRGFIRSKPAKYCFYAIYPAHLMLLWLFI